MAQDPAVMRESSNGLESHYNLLIKEQLAPGWSEWFEGLAVTYTVVGETRLSGIIPDQPVLSGLLARIRDLNPTLISLNRINTDEPGVSKKEE